MACQLRITRIPEPLPCTMPVRPGTEGDCEPREPDDRAEYCATDAWWLLGDLAVCDQHLRYALQVAGDDYEAMLADYRRRWPDAVAEVPNETERQPWCERRRHLDHVSRLPGRHAPRWRPRAVGAQGARSMRRRCGR
jgi:hypothetical protein